MAFGELKEKVLRLLAMDMKFLAWTHKVPAEIAGPLGTFFQNHQ